MAQIFVSYKRVDKNKVFPLVEKIERELGCNCWVDLDGIESSVQFASVICSAIDKSDVVLFMHSSVHLTIDFETDWTVKELTYAQMKKKRVVLVKLDDAPLDNIFLMEYGSKNNIDSQDPTQFNKLLNDLRAWLKLQTPLPSSDIMCPCGSGKLFKDCHGRTVAPAPAPVAKPVSAPSPSPEPVERTWKVGDYYNVDGKEGVVFWVDETGKHGKIVSLDQKGLQWCRDKEYKQGLSGIATEKSDGMRNFQSMTKIFNWRKKYPAFAWCADHGSGWYLPAIDELKELVLNGDVRYKVNEALTKKGIYVMLPRIGEFGSYWSSTEYDKWSAWDVNMYDGSTNSTDRFNSRSVRAVSAF